MKLRQLLALPALLSLATSLALQKRDADFYSVRTKMVKDMSGKGGDPKDKYWHESVFHPHYDGRFAETTLGYQDRKKALSNLIQTYLATFADIGIETWLMHGTLLGWWWNRKALPWDSDSDVQVTESSMEYLAMYYNMSVFHYQTPRIPEGRDYMLEINSHYKIREQTDRLNVIDARYIDTTSGLFIDITTARYNKTHPKGPDMLVCKDGHEYRDTYIFPLRDTYFEGVPAKIPFAYKELLEAEYKPKALTTTDFEHHHFDEVKLEWIPIKEADEIKTPKPNVPATQPEMPASQPKMPNAQDQDGNLADAPVAQSRPPKAAAEKVKKIQAEQKEKMEEARKVEEGKVAQEAKAGGLD